MDLVVEAELVRGVEQGRDIFSRDPALDVVDGVEDVPAAGLESLDVPADVRPHLPGRGKGQDALGVDPAAPEDDLRSELLLQGRGSMSRALIWTGFRISTPLSIRSGMYSTHEPHVWYQTFALREGLDVLHEPHLPRLHDAPVEIRREQRPALPGKVVADHHDIHKVSHLREEPV